MPAQAAPAAPLDVLEISYSVDGKEWHEIATVLADQTEPASFRVPLSSWDELHSFQVSVRAHLGGTAIPNVLLDGFELEARYEAKAPLPEPPPPGPRAFDPLTLDPLARHSCVIDPFQIEMVPHGSAVARVALTPSADPAPSSTLILGELPPGLTGTVSLENATSAALALVAGPRFRPGSYNASVFYSESSEDRPTSTAVCQFNLILRP